MESDQITHTTNEKLIKEKLTHLFIGNMFECFQDGNNLYFLMEFIQGGELFTYLGNLERFPNHLARFYAAEVFIALEYLHFNHILYRDLKPENIMISNSGHIKLIDMGFAIMMNSSNKVNTKLLTV